jgi:hypothetical protein
LRKILSNKKTNMKKFLMVGVIGFLFLQACNRTGQEARITPETDNTSVAQVADSSTGIQEDGYTLLKQRCFICHQEKPAYGNHADLKAPPMPGVKMHYLKKYPRKEDFIRAITEWVKNPSADKSIMKGAIDEFGPMPPFPYPDDELHKIAGAIYDLPVPKGHGKGKCGRGMH